LTTKMLASTMHISTHNQPTTHHPTPTPTPQPTTHSSRHQRQAKTVCEARQHLAAQKQQPHHEPNTDPNHGCSFRTQQGVQRQPPAAPTPTLHTPTPTDNSRRRCKVVLAGASRCRPTDYASVSAT